MPRVLLAFSDMGLGVQLQEGLEAIGLTVSWDAATASGPTLGIAERLVDVVVLDGDALRDRLPAAAAAWRARDPAPGLVAVGSRAGEAGANAAQVRLLPADTDTHTLRAAIEEAARLRFAGGMTPGLIRRALGLDPGAADDTVMEATRSIDVELPRAALRWHSQHYVTATDRIAALREARALTIPEVEFVAQLNGTSTVQVLIRRGPIQPWHAVRLIWALASVGAVLITPEIVDSATPERRALAAIRHHLRARLARLEKSTFYDVLEISPLAEYPDIEHAYALCARRYSPQALAGHDLSDLAVHVEPLWQLVEKAHSVLVDIAARGRYNDWVRSRWGELRTLWAVEINAARTAAEAYGRAQKALGDGDVHRAIGELATACRNFPGHPEYESGLCWARYRVQVGAGKDRAVVARSEREKAEGYLAGTRPWPRALLALALLCAADSDPEAARWHLREALEIDASLPAARQLLARLGAR
jgi:hypothetical protein